MAHASSLFDKHFAGPLQIEPVTNPVTNPATPILPTLATRPRISGEGDGGLFGQETPGGIGTLNPGALGSLPVTDCSRRYVRGQHPSEQTRVLGHIRPPVRQNV